MICRLKPSTIALPCWGTSLVLAVSACCVSISDAKQPRPPAPPAAATPDPATQAPVAQDPQHSDDMTSWVIEGDMRRTPKIPGVITQLPPHVEQRLNYAFDLAQRGATYSAANEFQAVLGLCTLEIDARSGSTEHREALRQGLLALDEADQFSGDQLDWRDSADVRRLAANHSTPVLHGQNQPVDAIRAVQAYYAFAEDRLTYACAGLPGASLAYYGLARTITVPGTRVAHSAGKAVLYHRVALQITPQNVLAANELAVLLAQHGQLDDAEKMLQHSVSVQPTTDAYRSLAAVYSREGNVQASKNAAAAGEALAAREREAKGAVTQVAAVTPVSNTDAKTESKEQTGLFPKLRFSQLPSIFQR